MERHALMLPPAPRYRGDHTHTHYNKTQHQQQDLELGARVEAAWFGAWYGAQVMAIGGDEAARVRFDDGTESTVKRSEIRAARLLEGTSVELRVANHGWAPGKVRALARLISNGSHSAAALTPLAPSRALPVQVARTRRDGSYDIELESGEIRKSARPVDVREAVGPCAPTSPDAISPPASPEEVAMAASPPPATRAFSIGDTVEANCRGLGQYYMGVVTAILDDGSFRISYTDGDCESGVPERYMRRTQTRRRPSKAAHAGKSGAVRSPLKSIQNKVCGRPVAHTAASCVVHR